jgi:hypothetical protein
LVVPRSIPTALDMDVPPGAGGCEGMVPGVLRRHIPIGGRAADLNPT